MFGGPCCCVVGNTVPQLQCEFNAGETSANNCEARSIAITCDFGEPLVKGDRFRDRIDRVRLVRAREHRSTHRAARGDNRASVFQLLLVIEHELARYVIERVSLTGHELNTNLLQDWGKINL